MDLPASVTSFMLIGVSLLGIDSVMRPKADRVAANLPKGNVTGRVVVDVNK